MSSVVRVHPPPRKFLSFRLERSETEKSQFFLKKFLHIQKKAVFLQRNGLVAQLDRVPDYGSGGCGFDSRLVHKKKLAEMSAFFVI